MDNTPAARTGWITYDNLMGPTLDSNLWEPANFDSGHCSEPEGEGSRHGQDGRASWRNFAYSLPADD